MKIGIAINGIPMMLWLTSLVAASLILGPGQVFGQQSNSRGRCEVRYRRSSDGRVTRVETSPSRYVVTSTRDSYVQYQVNDDDVRIYNQQGLGGRTTRQELENGNDSRYRDMMREVQNVEPSMGYENERYYVRDESDHAQSIRMDSRGNTVYREERTTIIDEYGNTRATYIIRTREAPQTQVTIVDRDCAFEQVDLTQDREVRESVMRHEDTTNNYSNDYSRSYGHGMRGGRRGTGRYNQNGYMAYNGMRGY